MGSVVVLGSINMDLVVSVPHLPRPGETLLGGAFVTTHGGKGANQAVAAARAGASVRMIGRLGADAFGDELRNVLEAEGIDVSHVGTCKHDPSGVALITVESGTDSGGSGENTIVVAAGANAMIRTVHLDDASGAGAFSGASVFVAQLEVPIDVVHHAAELAAEAGATVILNPSPVQDLPDGLLALVDVLIVNQTELEALGGIDEVKRRVGAVVHTRGAEGLEVHDSAGVHIISAHKIKPRDTTGAGDACCGAIAAALAAGLDLRTAAARGNAAGAYTALQLGARTSPRMEQIDDMLRQ